MGSRYDVDGRVALVTGAAQGIGYETARLLRGRGASVVLVDLDAQAAEEAAARIDGRRALGLAADVTDASAMEEVVAHTVERFGGLDVVVANAGIAPTAATMRSGDPTLYERVIEVNLLGVWRTIRPALPQIVERSGHVVAVASVYAFMNGALLASYAVSKAGVEQLGRALRIELTPSGASASVAYFGFIDTEMVRLGFSDSLAKRVEDTFPAFMLRRLPASAAAEAIVRGIELRSPRIIAPRWWAVLSVLRGVLGPLLDRRQEGDQRMLDIVRDAERRQQPSPSGGAEKALRTR